MMRFVTVLARLARDVECWFWNAIGFGSGIKPAVEDITALLHIHTASVSLPDILILAQVLDFEWLGFSLDFY